MITVGKQADSRTPVRDVIKVKRTFSRANGLKQTKPPTEKPDQKEAGQHVKALIPRQSDQHQKRGKRGNQRIECIPCLRRRKRKRPPNRPPIRQRRQYL